MTTTTVDPISYAEVLLPTTRGPQPASGPEPMPGGVSFGFGKLTALPPCGAWDLSGVTYDPVTGLNTDTTTGAPAVFSPELKSHTNYDTVQDHQKWTDSDTD